jgi:hypothetical protein
MPLSRRTYLVAFLLIIATTGLSLRAIRNDRAFSPYTTPPLPQHASGDFDGDGRPDLARILDEGTPQISIQLSGSASSIELDASVAVLVGGDVDDDGDLDLIATTSSNDVFIWLNDGHGRFTREEPSRRHGFSGEFALADPSTSAPTAIGLAAPVTDSPKRREARIGATRIRPPTAPLDWGRPSLHPQSLRAPPFASI